MKILSNLIFVIGRQRSGTTVFRKMLLSGKGVIDIGEIFHSDYTGNENCFFHFLAKQIEYSPHLLHVGQHKKVFGDFVQYLSHKHRSANLLIDIKYNAFDMIRDFNRSDLSTPFIVNFLKNNNFPVFHIERKNKLRIIVSETIAMKTKQWQLKAEIEKVETPKVFLNPFGLMLVLRDEENLTRQFKKYFCDYNKYYCFVYEHMFDKSGNFKDVVLRIAKGVFNNSPDFNPTPLLIKQNNQPLKELIENFYQVEEALKGTRFEHYLRF